MIHSSYMVAITSPARWGYSSVDVFFGAVRERPDRVVVEAGDLLRRDETGEIVVFKGREGNSLVTELFLVEAVIDEGDPRVKALLDDNAHPMFGDAPVSEEEWASMIEAAVATVRGESA